MLWLVVFLLGWTSCNAGEYWWYDKTYVHHDRPTMVHLFEWKWTDVANECEKFLQYHGYGAVQISPPIEHITLTKNGDMPWWVRYQPVSYKFTTRSGNEQELKDMINRCNKVGVRIISDFMLNHMAGEGQKPGENGVGAWGGSTFNAHDGIESFPEVPYDKRDFNDDKCHGNIPSSAYKGNAEQVRNCRLTGLLDLNQGSEYVRSKEIEALNKLIDMGVAGFRLDASKHMHPEDLGKILDGMKNLREDIFGANQRPFVVHEVIDQGGEAVHAAEYTSVGRYTNFNFGGIVSMCAKRQRNFRDIAKLGPGFEYGNLADNDVLNFIDNHDNQRGGFIANYKNGNTYKLAVGFLLGHPYGFKRVMSSYYFNSNDQGPPSFGSAQGFATKSPQFNSDMTCVQSSGWVCEHRWPEVRRMVVFRSYTAGAAETEVATEDSRFRFARVGKGYFALNNAYNDWNLNSIQTTLPAGAYCDVYSGEMQNGRCTGVTINVGSDGKASFRVPKEQFVAIHVGARLQGVPPEEPIPESWKRTVIFIKKDTYSGQNLFLRGGINGKGDCKSGPYQQASDPCAIPIAHTTTTPEFYTEYRSWSENDKYFDFEGAEETQGTFDGTLASGTPLAYSTDDKNAVQYQPLNTFGSGYWMVEFRMDCSKTNDGWFEFKGFIDKNSVWESNIQQGSCTGDLPGTAPFSSINHIAKCGYINAFEFGSNSCVINNFPQ